QALGSQACPLERIYRHVDLGALAAADLLAVVEHRRLVLLALADHDDAGHLDRVEDGAHAVDGRLVGGFLLAAADPAAGAHGCGLRHAHQLEREVAVRRIRRGLSDRGFGPGHRPRSYIRSGASTPIRSRQRAITACVAVQSPSRNACASLASTRGWW